MRAGLKIAVILCGMICATGCMSRGKIVDTKTLDKPVAVACKVETPSECLSAYALDRVSETDDAVTINRAMRAEIEQRRACEIKVLAALKGCNGVN